MILTGQAVTLSETLTTAAGTATDATVVLTVTKPDGTAFTPAVTHSSTGVYSATVCPDQAGIWPYEWVATGALNAVSAGQFTVTDQTLPPLASPNDVTDRFGRTLTDIELALVPTLLEDASRRIRQYTGRTFVAGSQTRIFRIVSNRVVLPRPVVSVDSFSVIGWAMTPLPVPFLWDGIDSIDMSWSWIDETLVPMWARRWMAMGWAPVTASVTWTAATVPEQLATVREIAAGMVVTYLGSPSPADGLAGVASVRFGRYFEMGLNPGAVAGRVSLSAQDREDLKPLMHRNLPRTVELRP